MRSGYGPIAWALAALALGAPAATAQAFDHSAWDDLVGRVVAAGGVRYAALQQDRASLDAYVSALATVDSTTFDAWPRPARIAYLVNAYNALVVAQVLDAYPIRRSLLNPKGWLRPASSVWQIPRFFDGIRHRVAGRNLSLDDIEHVFLRAALDEPRIHFALVCAAASCPPFRTEAYAAERLDEQLDDQAARFFNDPARNVFDPSGGRVRLSSILRWFGTDFARFAPASGYPGDAAQRGSLAFAARHLPEATAEWLRTGDYSVDYLDYDWTLNDASRRVARR